MKDRIKQKLTKTSGNWLQTLIMLMVTALGFYSSYVFAAPETLGGVAAQVTDSFGQLAQLITAGAYIAGFGFALGAILKFKQHKDNPTQIPIGTPIAMLFVAAALIFLPNIFATAGSTIFGSAATTAGATGISTF